MRRQGAFAWLLILEAIVTSGCGQRPIRSGEVSPLQNPPATAQRRDEEAGGVTFQDVLRIAQTRSADAKPQLVLIRDTGTDRSLSMLARLILLRWDDRANTYYSDAPLLLDNTCIEPDVLMRMYPALIEVTRVYVDVRVDASGRPLRATILRDAGDEPLRRAVSNSLMHKRYVPAKTGDAYVASSMTVECRLEVR